MISDAWFKPFCVFCTHFRLQNKPGRKMWMWKVQYWFPFGFVLLINFSAFKVEKKCTHFLVEFYWVSISADMPRPGKLKVWTSWWILAVCMSLPNLNSLEPYFTIHCSFMIDCILKLWLFIEWSRRVIFQDFEFLVWPLLPLLAPTGALIVIVCY